MPLMVVENFRQIVPLSPETRPIGTIVPIVPVTSFSQGSVFPAGSDTKTVSITSRTLSQSEGSTVSSSAVVVSKAGVEEVVFELSTSGPKPVIEQPDKPMIEHIIANENIDFVERYVGFTNILNRLRIP